MKADQARGRLLLERALRADPAYLPALYAYATTKPTHDSRMQALNWLAALDADNAEPYYLMAIEQHCHVATDGKRPQPDDDLGAFTLSLEEWQPIFDLIEEGNRRPEFTWRVPSLPSPQDVRVTSGGNSWPQAAVTSFLPLGMELWGSPGDVQFDPHAVTGAIWRQLARQAVWASRLASKSGDSTRALSYLTVMMDLGYKSAGCKPERMGPLLMGKAIWDTGEDEAVRILGPGNNEAAVSKLEAEKGAWKSACQQCGPLLEKTNVTVKQVRISRSEYLTYNDYAIEEAGMKRILAGLKR